MARALPNDPIYPPLLRGAVIRGMKLGRESGEWGREEIDNLPIGPGGAAEDDDETRPTDLTPPTRRQTAGIITSRQGKGRGPGIYSGTAMGAFWGRLGARQGEKARSTCRIVIPP